MSIRNFKNYPEKNVLKSLIYPQVLFKDLKMKIWNVKPSKLFGKIREFVLKINVVYMPQVELFQSFCL